jgi:hypothetical protein
MEGMQLRQEEVMLEIIFARRQQIIKANILYPESQPQKCAF